MTEKKTIVVIGASADRNKYGNIAVRTYADQGWTVYPVNPHGGTIEGIEVYKSIKDVPGEIERVSVYLPPRRVLTILDDIAARQPAEVWLNPGTESEEVLARAAELGLNVIQACSIVDQGVHPNQYKE